MTIGVLAKKAHVGIETIRFYQRKNILTEPKTSCGFREYSDSDLKKLQFIKKAQKSFHISEKLRILVVY